MAQAVPALSAPQHGRNPTANFENAALRCEVDAAFFVWAMLPPGSRREAKVRAHLAHLKARLGPVADAGREGVHHA